jgi:hypothetical protein
MLEDSRPALELMKTAAPCIGLGYTVELVKANCIGLSTDLSNLLSNIQRLRDA